MRQLAATVNDSDSRAPTYAAYPEAACALPLRPPSGDPGALLRRVAGPHSQEAAAAAVAGGGGVAGAVREADHVEDGDFKKTGNGVGF